MSAHSEEAEPDLTPETAAALSFEPMTLSGKMQTREDFLDTAGDLYAVMRLTWDLLQRDPRGMADRIWSVFDEQPGECLNTIRWAIDLLEDWKQVLTAMEARALVATSQRVMGMHG